MASDKTVKPDRDESPNLVDAIRNTQRDIDRGGREDNIGGALRAAYESAVREDIPPEMLELLSKLR